MVTAELGVIIVNLIEVELVIIRLMMKLMMRLIIRLMMRLKKKVEI